MHLVIALPLNLGIPRTEPKEVPTTTGPIRKIIKNRFRFDVLLVLFAVMFAPEGFIFSSVNTTLPFLLGVLFASSEVALLAATLLVPSQVLARVLLVFPGTFMTSIRRCR